VTDSVMLVGYFSSLDKTVIVISSLSVENRGKAVGEYIN
jgi:hypothetical protein